MLYALSTVTKNKKQKHKFMHACVCVCECTHAAVTVYAIRKSRYAHSSDNLIRFVSTSSTLQQCVIYRRVCLCACVCVSACRRRSAPRRRRRRLECVLERAARNRLWCWIQRRTRVQTSCTLAWINPTTTRTDTQTHTCESPRVERWLCINR